MLLDPSPLRKHREYRLLYIGQSVSLIGSMMTQVAVPYQMFELTGSSLLVGLLGTAQLVPLVLFALLGGSYADALDRRRLLLGSELILTAASAALAINAAMLHPRVEVLFGAAVLMSAVTGFHRPALDALTPRLVNVEDLAAVGALGSLRFNAAAIGGPAVAGLVMSKLGIGAAYWIDVASFAVSLGALYRMRPPPRIAGAAQPGLGAIAEGLRYAASRPELLGTYIVDLVAMTFAMPMALFPACAAAWGGAKAAGWLWAAMPVGSLAITLFSGWTRGVDRRGAAVIWAAAAWGAAIIGFGYAPGLGWAFAALALAGAADMVSGLFRGVIWNETIPAELRGRLAGVEMISYMTGPLLGNARAGWMATAWGTRNSIVWGGMACVAGVLACIPLLPAFYRYVRGTRGPDGPTSSA